MLLLFTSVSSDIIMLMISRNGSTVDITWSSPVFPNGDLEYTLTLTSTDLLTGNMTILII